MPNRRPMNRRRPRSLRRVFSAVTICVAFAGLLVPAAEARVEEVGPGMAVLGRLEGASAGGSDRIIALLPESRQMIHLKAHDGELYLRQYDLRSRLPRFVREVALEEAYRTSMYQFPGPYTTFTSDERRHRFMRIASGHVGSTLTVFDSRTLKGIAIRDLSETAPGFIAYGMTYSARDDRLYAIGEVGTNETGESTLGTISGIKPAALTQVVAMDASDGRVVWTKLVPQCRQPLYTSQTGSVIARSELQEAIYFACMRSFAYPGMSSIVRLWVAPGNDRGVASQQDMDSAKVESFPFSSAFTTSRGLFGIVRFDPPTDRMMVQSIAYASPGAWVFDGLRSAWVGQMGTPPSPEALGFSTYTGHAYMASTGSSFRYLDVGEVRATPAAQGRLYQLPTASSQSTIVTEPDGPRLFFPVFDLGPWGLGKSGEPGYVVLEDRVPRALPPDHVEYDELTMDIDEGPGTEATYAGSVSGFGSMINVVGGYKGLYSVAAGVAGADLLRVRGIAPGDRGVIGAQVRSLDVRDSGVTASARALAPDVVTDSDRGNVQESSRTRPSSLGSRIDDTIGAYATDTKGAGKTATSELGCSDVEGTNCATVADAAGQDITPDETTRELQTGSIGPAFDWRWYAATCLDAGNEQEDGVAPRQDAGPGGKATVACDFGTTQSSADSAYGLLSTEIPGVGTFDIGKSSFQASSVRVQGQGVLTRTTASAAGIHISIPEVGELIIARVTATAMTSADGRSGHADTDYERRFSGVRLTDAEGKVVFVCDDAKGSEHECDPVALARTINDVFESQVRVRVPEPDQEQTARGAFAGIRKSDGDYFNDLATNNLDSRAVPALDVLVINDAVEKSRLHVQLAGILASSIYGITATGDGAGFVPPAAIPPGSQIVPTVQGPQPIVDEGIAPTPSGFGGTIVRAMREALFLVRSPKEAAFVAMVWLLFAGAVASALRRRKVVALLNGE
jgi:hypothetical protein